jgi:hypothetical protein
MLVSGKSGNAWRARETMGLVPIPQPGDLVKVYFEPASGGEPEPLGTIIVSVVEQDEDGKWQITGWTDAPDET